MSDERTDVEGYGAHVQEHAGDVDKRGKEEDALATEEDRKEEPGEPLSEGPMTRRLTRKRPARFGPPVTVPWRPEWRVGRGWGGVAAAR